MWGCWGGDSATCNDSWDLGTRRNEPRRGNPEKEQVEQEGHDEFSSQQ